VLANIGTMNSDHGNSISWQKLVDQESLDDLIQQHGISGFVSSDYSLGQGDFSPERFA